MTNFGAPKAHTTLTPELQESPNLGSVPKLELTAQVIQGLQNTISESRLGTYLTRAGHDPARALKLYMWNAQVGEAFHLPIQSVEVALRNRINLALRNVYGEDWWQEAAFLAVADEERRADLAQVLKRIQNRNLPRCTGQVVAGLSFGFWAGMLQARYNPPIWGAQLRATFPDLPPDRGRKSLAQEANKIATLRNRIWHHEPIIKRDLSADYQMVTQMLGWICPTKAAWVVPHCVQPGDMADTCSET